MRQQEAGPSGDSLTVLSTIPFRLRIGVTGHRRLDNQPALAARIREVIERILVEVPDTPTTPVLLTVVSPLAEGADRLVANEVLKFPGAVLEVPLPTAVEDYRHEFADGSLEEFDRLCRDARVVLEAPPSQSREEAYERVGYYVVDRCDVLIALWDGNEARGRGGTAHIVERARACNMPMYWIDTGSIVSIIEERCANIARGVLSEARSFNRAPGDGSTFAHRVALETARLLPQDAEMSRRLGLDESAEWVARYYVRADQRAVLYRGLYHFGTWLLAGAAASAVVSAALQVEFWHNEWLTWCEVGLLVIVAVAFATGTRFRVHERWISYRFLAERFRSAFYLSLMNLGQRTEGGFDSTEDLEATQDWSTRAFAEVWAGRPDWRARPHIPSELGAFVASSWLGSLNREARAAEISYFREHSARLGRSYGFVTWFIRGLLLLTLTAAVVHLCVGQGSARPLTVSHVCGFLTLSLPAIGAAVTAVAADREYRRHSVRYKRLANQLASVGDDMNSVTTLEALASLVERAERIMLEESTDWLGVQRFHGFEPHP